MKVRQSNFDFIYRLSEYDTGPASALIRSQAGDITCCPFNMETKSESNQDDFNA